MFNCIFMRVVCAVYHNSGTVLRCTLLQVAFIRFLSIEVCVCEHDVIKYTWATTCMQACWTAYTAKRKKENISMPVASSLIISMPLSHVLDKYQ